MADCEIVENMACGTAFKYCRTHKVEPQDCPGAKKPQTVPGTNFVVGDTFEFQIAPRYTTPKREFKVGDRVKVLKTQGTISKYFHLLGGVHTVKALISFNSYVVIDDQLGATVAWPVDHTEHA